MKFKRFTKPKFLKQVGRELLGQLFGRFSEELAMRKVTLPAAELDDEAYFKALSGLALAPDGLPDRLIETLFAIEEMANEEGQERLEAAASQAGLALKWDEMPSHGDIAVQVFLAKPELLAEKHNEQRLIRLATFEYFGSRRPVDRRGEPPGPTAPDRPPFAAPGQPVLDLLVADLDAWFKEHNRGEQTASVEVFAMDGEFWFLVRHGDTFARTAKVEKKKTEMLHFRPAKDDVVVYSPERDELRIHAGTKGEKELYRRAFGRRLMGDDGHFSERMAYTLQPLRTKGADALDTAGIAGLTRIVLRECEVALDSGHGEVLIRKADDLFAAAADGPTRREAIPTGGRVVRAAFEVYFGSSRKPRTVQVRTPNTLRLGRHCDAHLVHQWLAAQEFRGNAEDGSKRVEGDGGRRGWRLMMGERVISEAGTRGGARLPA